MLEARKILYNQEDERPIILEDSILKKYAGFYLTKKGTEKEIIFESNKLFYRYKPKFKLELISVSKTKFIMNGFRPEVTYTFLLSDKGEVDGFHVQQIEQGVDIIAKRKK